MKDNRYFRNIALTVVLGVALAVCMVIRAMAPMAVLPQLDVPNVVLLSMIALLAEFYIAGEGKCNVLTFLFSAVAFGILPLACGAMEVTEALKLAVIGGVIFTLCAWLFDSVCDRLTTGPAAKAAPIFSALGIYLAAQCFAGMIL